MNTAEILTLCREAQANPDYVADCPEIAMSLITEALPQVCRALEEAQADNAKWQAIAQRRSEMQSQSEMDNAKLADFIGMYRAILRNIQGGKCEDLYLQGAIDNAGHLLSQNHPGAALLEELEQLRKIRDLSIKYKKLTEASEKLKDRKFIEEKEIDEDYFSFLLGDLAVTGQELDDFLAQTKAGDRP